MSRSFRNNSKSLQNQSKRIKNQRLQRNISQAQTSQDEKSVKIFKNNISPSPKKNPFSNNNKDRNFLQIDSDFNSKTQSSKKFANSQSSTTHQSQTIPNRTVPQKNTIPKELSPIKKLNPTVYGRSTFCPFPIPVEQPPKNKKPMIFDDDQGKMSEILSKLNVISYDSLNYHEAKKQFIKTCGQYLIFSDNLPKPITNLGEELIKNGRFHSCWIKTIKLQQDINLREFLESYDVLFRQKIQNYGHEFQNAIKFTEIRPNFFLGDKNLQERQHEANMKLKRYRSLFDQEQQDRYSKTRMNNNRPTSTTKLDTMMLYQKIKQELTMEQMQQKIEQTVGKTINQWKKKIQQVQKERIQLYTPICDTDLMFQTEQSILEKWNDVEELEKRRQAIEQLQRERVRERSPMSNRFRMMHQCQTNERRMQVEMACMFLNCEQFYYMQDLQILNVEETIFSETQEIVVLRAYAVEFDPKVGMMRLQPRIKTLISVYRFCGLSELIRLQKTYGKFDGMVVYPESFDIKKYLANNKELSLVKERFLDDVKGQIPISEQKNQLTANSVDEKIDY